MKTLLTRKQAERLFDLGVSERRASEPMTIVGEQQDNYKTFTIPDLIALVPDFERGTLFMKRDSDGYWFVGSVYSDGAQKTLDRRKELIDALYDLVVYCIKNGLMKL